MLPREPPGRSPSALLCGQKLVRAQNDWPVYFEEAPKLFEFGFRESIELEALARGITHSPIDELSQTLGFQERRPREGR